MDRIAEIRQRLASLEPELVELEDESHRHAGHAGARSGGGHFELRIVAACFSGKPTLARHRMIYTALGELMQTRIHALSILAQTPEESVQA